MKKRFLSFAVCAVLAVGMFAFCACKGDEPKEPDNKLPDPPAVNGILKIAGDWTVTSLVPSYMGTTTPPTPITPSESQYRISVSKEGSVVFICTTGYGAGTSVTYNGTAVMSEHYAYSFTFSGTAGEKTLSASASYNETSDLLLFSSITVTEGEQTSSPYSSATCKRVAGPALQ